MKKIPMRQCVGCREMHPKKDLIRVVKSPEGEISLDAKGKMPGRGAYVCSNSDCLARAKKSKAISRALDIAIPPEVFELLEQQMEEAQSAAKSSP